MKIKLRFPTLLSVLRVAAYAVGPWPTAYWGECPHCERLTPWQTNPVLGLYRCTVCGTNPANPEES